MYVDIHYWALSLLYHLISKKKLLHMMVRLLVSVLIVSVRQYKWDTEMLHKVRFLNFVMIRDI